MARIISILLIALLFCNAAVAQKSLLLKIIDSTSRKPIPFTLIKSNNTFIAYTDEMGLYLLTTNTPTSNISFSCIGYNDGSIVVNDGSENEIIVALARKQHALHEVVISTSVATKVIPYLAKKPDYYFHISNTPIEFASKISFSPEYPGASKRITRVKIRAKRVLNSNRLRIHIYGVDSFSKPGEELLAENIVYDAKSISRGEINIDLSAYNIIVPNYDFFVGIECFGVAGNIEGTPLGIGITHCCKAVNTYTRTYKHREWIPVAVSLEENGNPPNILVYLEYK